MLLRGAEPEVVSKALGRSLVASAMYAHSHIIERMQSDAMALSGELIPEGRSRVPHKDNANLTSRDDIALPEDW